MRSRECAHDSRGYATGEGETTMPCYAYVVLYVTSCVGCLVQLCGPGAHWIGAVRFMAAGGDVGRAVGAGGRRARWDWSLVRLTNPSLQLTLLALRYSLRLRYRTACLDRGEGPFSLTPVSPVLSASHSPSLSLFSSPLPFVVLPLAVSPAVTPD